MRHSSNDRHSWSAARSAAWSARTRVLTVGAAALAIGAAVLVACSNSGTSSNSESAVHFSTMNEEAVGAAELRRALLAAGLDPAALTAAGVTTQELPGVLADARDYLTEHVADLRTAESTFASTAQTVDRLTRAIQAGVAGQDDVAALAAATSGHATAAAERATILAGLRTAALADLSEPKRAAVTTLAGAGESPLPIQYRLVERSEADTVALRDALANVRIAGKLGAQADSESAALVTTADAHQDVAAAAARLPGLDGIATAWQNHTAE